MLKLLQSFFLFLLFSAAAQAAPTSAVQVQHSDSIVKIYHGNGKLKLKEHYRDGLEQGRWKEYDETGLLLSITRYKKGEMQWKREYSKGKIIKITYRDGRVKKFKNCGC